MSPWPEVFRDSCDSNQQFVMGRAIEPERCPLHQKQGKVTLLHLPSEIIFEIATYISLHDDLCCLVRTCRLTFNLLNLELYKRSCRGDNFAILWAAKTGSTATVKNALRVGVDSNMKASGLVKLIGDIALHRRTRSPTFGLVQMCHTMPGKTPLVLAAENGHGSVIRLLLQDPRAIISRLDAVHAVHAAVLNGHALAVELLLSYEISYPDRCDRQDATLLHIAASKGHATVISVLLSRTSVKVGAVDPYGRTPLHLATINGHAQTVKLLLEDDDTNVNVKDGRGNTPIHLAIMGHHMPIAKVLIDYKHTDISIGNRHGLQPLHLIARMNLQL